MAPQPDPRPATPVRRPARDLIEAVLENMRGSLELLKYSTLAPSRYLIYLHPAEYTRLEGILPRLQEETVRALAEELDKLNRRSAIRQYLDRWRGGAAPRVQSAGVDWQVEFLSDPDGELEEGAILIDSELLLPATPELGVGERTRRITTVHIGQRTTRREQTVTPWTSGAPQTVFARIVYDDNAGHHTYDVGKDSVTVGRGGIAFPVDIRISSVVDVSREHARIRRDPKTGRFFLIDLSLLGTSVDGRRIPKGYDEVEGTKRENGTEAALPDRTRIGLADTVYLDFEAIQRR